MKTFTKLLALAAAIAGLTQIAQAVPQIRVFDGTTTLTFTDNGAGDSQAAAGQVVWVGSIGSWSLNVHVGTTYPAVGSLSSPQLDLSFNATSSLAAPGTLQISFSADGFGPTFGSSLANIGGTLGSGASVTYNTYGGTNNTNFSTVNLLSSQGPFTGPPAAFSSTTTGGTVSNAGPYSLTQVVSITHGAGQGIQTTGDAHLTVPESGTSALLLGSGLMGIGLLARLRRRIA